MRDTIEASQETTVAERFRDYETEARHLQAVANDLPVTDAQTAAEAGVLTSRIQTALKRIDERRLAITAGARSFVANVNSYCQTFSGPLTVAKGQLAGRLAAWQKAEQARLEEERRAQERARAEALLAGSNVPAAVKAEEPAKVIATRRVLRYEVTGIEQIPREFLVVDDAKIRKALTGRASVPGVRYWYDEIPMVRGLK